MMLRQWYRVFYSDNGSLTDQSLNTQIDSTGFSGALVSSEDYLYIGQYFPFNNVFFLMDTVSTGSSVLSVEYWDGDQWISALDEIDGTNGFKKHGVLQFTPNEDESWDSVEDTSDTTDSPSELQTQTIYDLYWARIKASPSLPANVTIKRMGYAFCGTSDLKVYEPEIDRYLTPWGGASKTNWYEQIMAASELVIRDLKAKEIALHAGQILRFDDVNTATVFKTLSIIYSALGPAFEAKKTEKDREYSVLMNQKRWIIDINKNGIVEPLERAIGQGRLLR